MDDDDTGAAQAPPDPGSVAPETEKVQRNWDQVVADMESTAEGYRDDGWEVLEVHPGDVVALEDGQDGRWGLDVLAPDDEFDVLEEWVEVDDCTFDACEVFRGESAGVLYLVVAMQDADAGRVVLFPAYYDPNQAEGMLTAAREAGEMRTHVRSLAGNPIITFTQSDPSLFEP